MMAENSVMFGVCVRDFVLICLSLSCLHTVAGARRYKPEWNDLDSRPLPDWFDKAKVGIFLHWGVFSVPSFLNEWFVYDWAVHNADVVKFMKDNYRPTFTYADFAAQFTAEFYDPNFWADLFQASGAKYVVLTSKHHEGFTNWPSKYSFNWNSMDVGPKRDLLGDLANAVRNRTNLHFGLYHSLFEFFHPLYLQDKANGYKTQEFVKTKAMPELYELVNKYHPELIWSDGDWMVDSTYWNSTNFLAWLYNDSPVRDYIVVNDRWGNDSRCKHGGYFNCDDRYNPGVLQKHKFENAMTIDSRSWGYRRNAILSEYLTTHDLLKQMAESVSCGGNILINVGPTKEGTINTVFEERLREMGAWLKVNGEAIYESKPWTHQNDTVTKDIWYTSKKSPHGGYDVYAIILNWPKKGHLELGSVRPVSNITVSMLGYPVPFKWSRGPTGNLVVIIPNIPYDEMPCHYVWVLKIVGLSSF